MRITIAVFLYIGTATPLLAAPAPGTKLDTKFETADDKSLVTKPPVDWIKTYSLSPYSEMWNLSVTVKNLQRDLPKVLKVLETPGVALNTPLGQSIGNATEQQLSYRLSEKAAKNAVKKLKKFDPKVSPRMSHNGELVNVAEIREKLEKLVDERNRHRAELSATPSIATMVDEMIEHLTMVKKVRETVDTQVLLNMTVKEKR